MENKLLAHSLIGEAGSWKVIGVTEEEENEQSDEETRLLPKKGQTNLLSPAHYC